MVIRRHSARGSDDALGAREETADTPRATRRTAVAGGLGITALIAFPDVIAASTAQAATAGAADGSGSAATAAAAGGTPHFFLYGTTGPTTHPGVEERRAPVDGQSAASNLVTGLDVAPVRSADGNTLALVSTSAAGTPRAVTLTLVDTSTGVTATQRTLALPGASSAASILSKPVFAGTDTVALLVAVSEPSAPRTLHKVPANGVAAVTTGYAWTTTHQVAYFHRATATFSGPFPLRLGADPYLALTDAAADATHLYLWAVQDFTRIRSAKGSAQPTLTTEFYAVPLGSGTPDLTTASRGPWPSGVGAQILATGHVARVVAGRDLEAFSPSDGSLRTVAVAPMHEVSAAKPGSITLESRPDGTVVLTNSAFGRATVLDPAAGFTSVAAIDYPRVRYPVRGASVSSDGTTLYTLGAAGSGGLNAYRIATGALTASYTHGESYTGVYQLAGGNLLTLTAGSRTGLSFFTPGLEYVTAAATDVLVAGVY
ncbi:hypothetical protein KDL01_19275 [Actinospica durhamensis]|uniref:Uncharacterized protein n=1 Tax=Actinospica durhamensis TaxID=1508375 RepID=A0A941INH8_9ACTN|nr:hypothetical protein [Actinospica durhamensis]MBR7835425.1 hypothetical protein [Actinospica durhamensis]